jgi:hypothetical protein
MNDTPEQNPIAVSADFYFAIVPEWVLALPVSANAIRVYCCLRRFADNTTGECFPSRRLLAMRARISVSTLDRAIKELSDGGAIEITHRKSESGDYTSNLYIVRSFPKGVASNLVPPRLKAEGRGGITGGELTKATRTKTNNTPRKENWKDQWITKGIVFARLGWSYSRLMDEYEKDINFQLIQEGFLTVAKPHQLDIPLATSAGAPIQEAMQCEESENQ